MAVKITRSFTATQRGVGKPDYTREVSLGQVRPGLTLKYNQSLKINALVYSVVPSPFAWVQLGGLAPGATAHIVDMATGIALPYTVPQGYTYSVISRFLGSSQDVVNRGYMDHPPLVPVPVLIFEDHVVAGSYAYKTAIIGLTTGLLDPTAAYAHAVDNTYMNAGGADLYGSFQDIVVMEAVGTSPLPDKKDVRCKWCGHVEKGVHLYETVLKCPKCGEITIYFNTEQFRGSA